ncbi:isochorismatase [Candidatus Poribacteria bacterium]|nr:MAG: isochorismatase [Candidatus Poribacteria bacterium]
MSTPQLPLPEHFNANQVDKVWRIPYQERQREALTWAEQHSVSPASEDNFRTCLLLVDVQNTFCIPGFELFVGGRSGNGAVEDNIRLCQFIYHNLPHITKIACTLDTHTVMQIFHEVFWINDAGEHPLPLQTLITQEDIETGKWRVNPAVVSILNLPSGVPESNQYAWLKAYGEHYVKTLTADGKYPLTIWPYHAMLGGIGHAVVSAVDEACFFHTIARKTQVHYEIKGQNPLTENYSVLRPEVLNDANGQPIAEKNNMFLQILLEYDRVIIAGQAKSHCVAWTVSDLLAEIQQNDTELAKKIYLVDDLTSPVVVPGVVDYTEPADTAFAEASDAGMHVVQSTEPIAHWG